MRTPASRAIRASSRVYAKGCMAPPRGSSQPPRYPRAPVSRVTSATSRILAGTPRPIHCVARCSAARIAASECAAWIHPLASRGTFSFSRSINPKTAPGVAAPNCARAVPLFSPKCVTSQSGSYLNPRDHLPAIETRGAIADVRGIDDADRKPLACCVKTGTEPENTGPDDGEIAGFAGIEWIDWNGRRRYFSPSRRRRESAQGPRPPANEEIAKLFTIVKACKALSWPARL